MISLLWLCTPSNQWSNLVYAVGSSVPCLIAADSWDRRAVVWMILESDQIRVVVAGHGEGNLRGTRVGIFKELTEDEKSEENLCYMMRRPLGH